MEISIFFHLVNQKGFNVLKIISLISLLVIWVPILDNYEACVHP